VAQRETGGLTVYLYDEHGNAYELGADPGALAPEQPWRRPRRARRPRPERTPEQRKQLGELLLSLALLAAVLAGAGYGAVTHRLHVPGIGGGHSVTASVSGNAALGERLAAREYGWTGQQFTCLNDLWSGESGWSNTADTRSSGLDPAGASVFAYGIPQARGHGPVVGGVTAPYPAPYTEANPPGLGGDSNPRQQIRWGLAYIHDTYGSPCGALAFKTSNGGIGY
jgi:hypothetical protein